MDKQHVERPEQAAEHPPSQRPRYYYDQLQGQKIARDGDHVWGWGSAGGRKRADRRARMYIDEGEIRQGTLALEVGCGTGIFTERVNRLANARIVAFDVSLDLIRVARGKHDTAGTLFVVADCEALPFRDDVFASAYGSSVLHHLDLDCSLQELRRVCGPGARIVFTEPNMMNPQIILQKNIPAIGRAVGDIPGETAFVRWSLRKKLHSLGFSDILIRPFDFLHPLVPRSLVDTIDGWSRKLERVPGLREIAGSLLIVFRKAR